MKAATAKEIKDELKFKSQDELMQLCLRLSRFKKENKELLTYLLFEAHDEDSYIAAVKTHLDTQFETINTDSYFYIKKSMRKILRELKKHIRYSLKTETEVELLLYFCEKLQEFRPSIKRNTVLTNMYHRQMELISNKLPKLHEDLQYDFKLELDELRQTF